MTITAPAPAATTAAATRTIHTTELSVLFSAGVSAPMVVISVASVVASGTPEEVAEVEESYTGAFLREVLG